MDTAHQYLGYEGIDMEQELKCKDCNRHLGTANGTVVAELKCSNSSCRATTQFKIINGDITKDIRYKFTTPAQPPKQKAVEVS